MRLNKLFLIIFTVVSISFLACGDDGSDPGNGLSSNSAEILGNSIIDLPQSLSGRDAARAIKGSKVSKANEDPCSCDNDDSMVNIYEGIRCYVGLAEEIKAGVKELIIAIGHVIPYLPVGVEYVVPDPKEDDPLRVKLEMPEGEAYEWKLSFYYTETGDPEMIVRFTFEGMGAKGRLIWKMVEENEELAKVGIHLDTEHAIDVAFDGTSQTRTLEVRFASDLSPIIAMEAEGDLDSLTQKQREKVLGQAEKVFINTILDTQAAEYTIYGTSYHPGWEALNTEIFGEDRSIYLFKAKAKSNSDEEAKLYLSLPFETRDNITGVWEEDSIGVVVTDFLTAEVNRILVRLADDTDDPVEDPEDPTDPFIGNLAQEQLLADNIVTWITGEDPPVDHAISKAELEAFVFSDQSGDTDAESFQNGYKSISYMINPAFYDKTNGFLGTYDIDDDTFYVYGSDSLTPGSKPGNFDVIYNLDLSNISPYVPTQVVASTIKVE